MPQSTPAVDTAFQQLAACLDAEIEEYRKIGATVFHSGAPRQAQSLLHRANEHAALRQQVSALHDKWKAGSTSPPPPPAVTPSASYLKLERGQPGLIRNIKGMTTPQAAKLLGVSPASILGWLESGALKGYQKVGGTWKITKPDLIAFSRNRRDLLVPDKKE